MITLSLAKLEPGMILAEPVHNFQGVLLLDTGAQLSGKSIQILKSWGVAKACVLGEAVEKDSRDAKVRDKARSEIEKRLKEKFSDVPKNPAVVEIMRVAAILLEQRSLIKEGQDEIS